MPFEPGRPKAMSLIADHVLSLTIDDLVAGRCKKAMPSDDTYPDRGIPGCLPLDLSFSQWPWVLEKDPFPTDLVGMITLDLVQSRRGVTGDDDTAAVAFFDLFHSHCFVLTLFGVGAGTRAPGTAVKCSAAKFVALANVTLGKYTQSMARAVILGKGFGDVDL